MNAEGWSLPSPVFYFATKGAGMKHNYILLQKSFKIQSLILAAMNTFFVFQAAQLFHVVFLVRMHATTFCSCANFLHAKFVHPFPFYFFVQPRPPATADFFNLYLPYCTLCIFSEPRQAEVTSGAGQAGLLPLLLLTLLSLLSLSQ